ncbi:hypothetical protein ABBQ32_007201 [Trebouxia sp. C0010 RCD-2024]
MSYCQLAWPGPGGKWVLVGSKKSACWLGAGSSVQHQDFATFLTKSRAAGHAINRTLSMLFAAEPQPPQTVSLLTSEGGPAVQYASDPCAFALPPAQTRAVMTQAQAQEDLAWQSTLTEQVRAVSTAVVAAPISDALATQVSRGLMYAKGPVAYSIAGSHESDSSLIPAANTQWLQAEHSRSSLATSAA